MQSTTKRFHRAIAVLALTTLSACGGATGGQIPEGEDDLSCAALMFAANSQIENSEYKADIDIVKDKYLAGVTRYATAYAKAKGFDSQQALGAVKLKAYRMTGTISGSGDRVPTADIVRRAKACALAA